MSKYRSRMSRGSNRRNFVTRSVAHPKNYLTAPMRGGIRL